MHKLSTAAPADEEKGPEQPTDEEDHFIPKYVEESQDEEDTSYGETIYDDALLAMGQTGHPKRAH